MSQYFSRDRGLLVVGIVYGAAMLLSLWVLGAQEHSAWMRVALGLSLGPAGACSGGALSLWWSGFRWSPPP